MVLGLLIATPNPCKYQNDNGLCTIYDDRFIKTDFCLPICQAVKAKLVPETCGYVDKNYKSNVDIWMGVKDAVQE